MYYMILSWRLKGTDREMRARFRAMEEKRDTCILGLVDGFLESAMQLLLQLYLAFYHSLPASFLRSKYMFYLNPGKHWLVRYHADDQTYGSICVNNIIFKIYIDYFHGSVSFI